MIWFIIWMLIGLAGGIHALFVFRRDIDKDYPWLDLKSDPLINNLDDVMIILISAMIGPFSFLVTAYTFPRSFFK